VRRRAAWLLALIPAFGGCTVTAVDPGVNSGSPSNSCKSDADCDEGRCRDAVCQTLNGEIEALLVSATPPSDSSIPQLTFVAQIEDVPTSGGEPYLSLSGPSRVVGKFELPKGATCYPDFVISDPLNPILGADDRKTLPVTVTLALSQRLLGLPQQLIFASTRARNKQGGYTFEVQVPRGEYDVYLVAPPQESGCAVPPQLYRGVQIVKENDPFTFVLSDVAELGLDIRWPKSSPSLLGWTVDIIEPLGGNPISTELILGEPTDLGEPSPSVEYSATLSYSTVTVAASATATPSVAASDLLRLRPPVGQVAPTIFLDRSALGLLLKVGQRVVLDRFTSLPQAVGVEGQVAREDDGSPVGGYVTFVSTEIYGVDAGIFASYQTTVQVGVDGALHAQLPPGKYRVQAVPPLSTTLDLTGALAALETTWDIPADLPVQYGKLLELRRTSAVVGKTRFVGAQVQAVPSPQTTLPFDQAFGAGPFVPRPGAGLVDSAGQFVVNADPGRFDLTVQAPESLGFGWFVRPGVDVAERNVDLGSVTLPTPSVLSSTALVTVNGAEVPLASAAIRAYAYLDKNLAYTREAKQAVSVVQVAETRADENGTFHLLVPSRIVAPK
jgi:hypothetical protein